MDDAVTHLRVLVLSSGRSAELVAMLLREPPLDHTWQLIGDGLMRAVLDGVDGAEDVAREHAARLRDRGWTGDQELAEQLEGALGPTEGSGSTTLPVDLEELAAVLEGDPLSGRGRINLVIGEVWSAPALEYARDEGELEDADDPDRWLIVDCEGSRDGFRDMERFVDGLGDHPPAGRLHRALGGRGRGQPRRGTPLS